MLPVQNLEDWSVYFRPVGCLGTLTVFLAWRARVRFAFASWGVTRNQWEPRASFAIRPHIPFGTTSQFYLFLQIVILSWWGSTSCWLGTHCQVLKMQRRKESSLNHYHFLATFPSSQSICMLKKKNMWKTLNLLHIIGSFTEEISTGCSASWGMCLISGKFRLSENEASFPWLLEKAVCLQRPLWEITNRFSRPTQCWNGKKWDLNHKERGSAAAWAGSSLPL